MKEQWIDRINLTLLWMFVLRFVVDDQVRTSLF